MTFDAMLDALWSVSRLSDRRPLDDALGRLDRRTAMVIRSWVVVDDRRRWSLGIALRLRRVGLA